MAWFRQRDLRMVHFRQKAKQKGIDTRIDRAYLIPGLRRTRTKEVLQN